jgi:hypothetical protein
MKKTGEVLDLMTPPPPRTPPGSVVDLRSPTLVSRRLTYEATEDGGDKGAGNDATSRSGDQEAKPSLFRKAMVMVVRLANLQL